MQFSSNEFDCWFLITICCFLSSELSANIETPPRKDADGHCATGILQDSHAIRFSASSVLRNDPELGPESSRIVGLHDVFTPKAWCPDKPVHNTPTEWLQIEFSSAKFITCIFTQGRSDGNYGEFVPSYYFDYQRESSQTWYRYNDTKKGELILGNTDYRNSAYQKFESHLVVNRIRIVPISSKKTNVCLRVRLYGCDFKDEVVEYQMPRGDSIFRDGTSILFDDKNYDGQKFSNQTWLQGGMGRLMDNVIYAKANSVNKMQNYVVAWKRKSVSLNHIMILFKFRRARQFKSLVIYFTKYPVYRFDTVNALTVDFVNENEKGISEVTNSITVSDPSFSEEDIFSLDLKMFKSKHIIIKLYFKSDWIAINEVMFVTDDLRVDNPSIPSLYSTVNVNNNPFNPTTTTATTRSTIYVSQNLIYYIILITCIIGSIILLGVALFLCIHWMKQREKRRYKNKFFEHRSIAFNDPYTSTCGLRTIAGSNPLVYRPLTPHSYVPSMPNNSQNGGFRFVHSQYPSCPDYFPTPISSEYEAIDSCWPKTVSQSMTFSDNKMDNADRQTLINNPAPDITCTNKNGVIYCSASSYSSNVYSQPDNEINFPAPDLLPPNALTQESLNGIYKIHFNNPLKGPLGSTISNFQLAPASQTWIDKALSRIPEIDANQINLEALVTEGEIGAFVSGRLGKTNIEILVARYKPNNFKIDSKSLFYRQCFAKLREDFSSHPNLLSIIGHCLLGVVADVNTSSIIYAYPSQVNIVTFLKKLHLVPKTSDISFTCSYVSQSSLLYVVKQLAGALSYLSELGIVHKDVSARNCSIGEHFHLILSDFAIGMEEFKDDYIPIRLLPFNNDGNQQSVAVHLPLFWMPWEAIIMGNYSTKSDIWSFGVTMWEIFTECQMKPYSALCNQTQDLSLIIPNIIRNSMLIANNHPSSILPNNRSLDLTQIVHDNPSNPLDSSKQIRDIMTDCWKSDPAVRPSFQRLHSLLCNLIPTSKPLDEYGALYQLIC